MKTAHLRGFRVKLFEEFEKLFLEKVSQGRLSTV